MAKSDFTGVMQFKTETVSHDLCRKNWGFNRRQMNQGDSFFLKRVIFQENRSDNKKEQSHTDMSDDI
jgi:hypothetical protein